MPLKPMPGKVVVERQASEDKVGSIIVPDVAKKKAHRATVVAVGPGKRLKDGGFLPACCEPGQVVLVADYTRDPIDFDGKKLTLLDEDEVLAVVEG